MSSLPITSDVEPAPDRRYGGRSAQSRRTERRQKLVAAGLELFGSQGYAASSVKAICDEAGVSPRYFYEHFADRQSLMLDVFGEVVDELMRATVQATLAAPDDVDARIRAGIRAYLAPLAADRRKARVLFSESIGVSLEVERERRARMDAFADFVREQSLALGTVKDETPENNLIAHGLIGASHEIANQAIQGGDTFDLDAVTEQCCLIFIAVSDRLRAAS